MNFNFDSAVNMTQAVLSVKEELLLSVCKAEDFQPQDGIFIDPRVTEDCNNIKTLQIDLQMRIMECANMGKGYTDYYDLRLALEELGTKYSEVFILPQQALEYFQDVLRAQGFTVGHYQVKWCDY